MKTDGYPRIFPLGDSALTVEFGCVISVELNRMSIALAAAFDADGFDGYIESVPAYASTTVFYEPATVRRAYPRSTSAAETVQEIIKSKLPRLALDQRTDSEPIIIPIDVSARAGLDLEFLAVNSSLTVDEVISVFTSTVYRVYMLGFLPGFPYMGQVDERIAAPRKPSPRATVPKGSVGIAGRQTGIYPFDSPGGWQLIGRTDLEIFRADREVPCLLKPGDRVRFVPA